MPIKDTQRNKEYQRKWQMNKRAKKNVEPIVEPIVEPLFEPVFKFNREQTYYLQSVISKDLKFKSTLETTPEIKSEIDVCNSILTSFGKHTCPVCYEDYQVIDNNKNHNIRNGCNHSLCCACFKRMLDMNNFHCPLCRGDIKKLVQSYNPNVVVETNNQDETDSDAEDRFDLEYCARRYRRANFTISMSMKQLFTPLVRGAQHIKLALQHQENRRLYQMFDLFGRDICEDDIIKFLIDENVSSRTYYEGTYYDEENDWYTLGFAG